MELYQSKNGHIDSKQAWEQHLNNFWDIFSEASSSKLSNLPTRPADAWERYVKVIGLVKIV